MTQQVMEFFQEKVLGECLTSKKLSTGFTNLCRAVACIEQKMTDSEAGANESQEPGANESQEAGANDSQEAGVNESQLGEDDDGTQEYCDFHY